MSIRPMEPAEVRKALRRAAVVCIEQDRSDWFSIEVCVADGSFWAAGGFSVEGELFAESDAEQAAYFLLMVAAAMEATNA